MSPSKLALALLLISSVAVAAPVDRILARARVHDPMLRIGGTVDSVAYAAGLYGARRDSAQLWVQVHPFAAWPLDTVSAEPQARFELDALGNGSFEWLATVEARGFYRVAQPPDWKRKGEGQEPFFFDDGAYVRATYMGGALSSLVAWGVERLVAPDSLGYGQDQGQAWVLRSQGPPWSNSSGLWLRLELTRDSLALQELVP